MNNENAALKKEINTLRSVVNNQQRFLEQVDSKLRNQNLVMMGVSETNPIGGAESDEDKVKKILEATEVEAGRYTFKRLGEVREEGRNRPILVTVESHEVRDKIVKNGEKLKGEYKDVRIKRDSHPAIRAEWRRLFNSETTERNKPENIGCKIEFDKKKRQITRDDVVIDSWQPLSFL